jgi:membrane-associated phospholipid phosphatase
MKISTVVLVVTLSAARVATAQIVAPVQTPETPTPLVAPLSAAQSPNIETANDARVFTPVNPSLFRSMGHDLTGFFSTDTAKVLGAFAVAGLLVTPVDSASVEDTSERLSRGVARFGNAGGSLAVQGGAGLATYMIGRATGKPAVAALGGDLVRAQVLSQLFVQGVKYTVGRERPDGSNRRSFPSGHTASSFATATILQQHFGWKAGIPAYAFAGFVGASRMASGKHYWSDVLVGAGLGIAAGRTVTLHMGGERFAVGAAPTQGGAMVTFTRH